jgi:hypothetical protein
MKPILLSISFVLVVAVGNMHAQQSTESEVTDFHQIALEHQRTGNFSYAIKYYGKAIRQNPNAELYLQRASCRTRIGRLATAKSDLKRAYELSETPRNANALAWFLATVSETSHRDGKLAVDVCKKSLLKVAQTRGAYADTVAAAHAQNGDFDNAIRYQKRAIRLGMDDRDLEAKNRLGLYQKGVTVADGYVDTGDVEVENTTAESIELNVSTWYDGNGENASNHSWKIEAGQSGILHVDDDKLFASKVLYSIKTDHGRTPTDSSKVWSASKQGQVVTIKVTAELLPRKRIVVAKPAIPDRKGVASFLDKVDADSINKAQSKIKETADTIKSVVETAKEIKEMTGGSTDFASTNHGNLTVDSISVSRNKSNGKSWDGFGGKPDLQVMIRVGYGVLGDKGHTSKSQNRTSVTFNEPIVNVDAGDEITITVIDVDALEDDIVGKLKVTITQSMIDKGSVDWSFDQVNSMKLSFER